MSGQFGIINPFRNWKIGDLPCDPTITVVLKEWSMIDAFVTVSASLASDSEIDSAIDRLMKDLESTRSEAKRVLKAQQEKIRQSIGS